MFLKYSRTWFLPLVLLACSVPAPSFTVVASRRGMVVSSESLASDAGIEMLRTGGNAVDAAVAVGFVLAVTHSSAGNLGGGGFMLIRRTSGKTLVTQITVLEAGALVGMRLDRDAVLRLPSCT